MKGAGVQYLIVIEMVVRMEKECKNTNEEENMKKNVKKVVIPKKVKYAGVSYKVTMIGKNAFKNCKKLKTLTIKSTSIKSIKKSAFSGCKKTVNVKLPKSKAKVYRKMLKKAGLKL